MLRSIVVAAAVLQWLPREPTPPTASSDVFATIAESVMRVVTAVMMPPNPSSPLLPLTVEFVMTSDAPAAMPPPKPLSVRLSRTMELVTVSEPSLAMPPPSSFAVLPSTTLFVSTTAPSAWMPPPLPPSAVLPPI